VLGLPWMCALHRLSGAVVVWWCGAGVLPGLAVACRAYFCTIVQSF
jgi:hypothetical protein